MNGPHDPEQHDLDDLASALVDGLLDPDEAARLGADPDIATRAENIRSFRRVLRDVPPPPAGVQDIAVSAALGARDDAADDARPQIVMSEDDSRPIARPLAARKMRTWLAAAAGLAVIALTAALLSRLSDSDDDLAATTEDAREAEADDAPAGVDDAVRDDARAGAPEAGVRPAFPESSLPYLGEVDDATDLTSLVITRWRAGEDTLSEESHDAADAGPSQACNALSVSGDPDRGMSIYVAEARLAGERVMVHLYSPDGDNGNGDRMQLVATNRACDDLVDRAVVP